MQRFCKAFVYIVSVYLYLNVYPGMDPACYDWVIVRRYCP